MALGSHLITVRRLKKYIDDVIGKKANLPDTSKTIIGNISQINSDLTETKNRVTGSSQFSALDLPQGVSTSGKLTRLYIADESLRPATQIFNGGTLENSASIALLSDVTSETNARTSADGALQTQINNARAISNGTYTGDSNLSWNIGTYSIRDNIGYLNGRIKCNIALGAGQPYSIGHISPAPRAYTPFSGITDGEIPFLGEIRTTGDIIISTAHSALPANSLFAVNASFVV